MKLDELTKSILKSIFSLVLITLFAIFLIKAKSVIIYITTSMILKLMLNPFSSFLKSKLRFNNLFSSIGSLFLLILLTALLISSFIPLIIEQGKNLSLLNNSELKSNIKSIIASLNEYFETNSLSVYDFLSEITLFTTTLSIISSKNDF